MENQRKMAGSESTINIVKEGLQVELEPPIKLEKPIWSYNEDDLVKEKCRMNPADVNSEDYELTIPIFRKTSPKEWLDWMKNFQRAIVGHNPTTGAANYALARRLLEDGALQAFENAAHMTGNKTNDNYKLVIKAITAHVMPKKELKQQKRYM